MSAAVIYPGRSGAYPLVYFIPGAPAGFIPAEWYTDLLSRVVSHGFIVLAADAFWPAVDSPNNNLEALPDKHSINLQWESSSILAINYTQQNDSEFSHLFI